jgi:hypothetical protein
MNRPIRQIVIIALHLGAGAVAVAPTLSLATPNSHANPHANGDGNSGGNGNGNGSAVHQYVVANGLSQGAVSSQLKSWNSLNANPKALLNNLNNPNSLLGKESRYICANAASQSDLSTFTSLGGNPASAPTPDQFNAATAYLAAEAVIANPASSPTDLDAANALIAASSLTSQSAQAVVDQYNAWTAYQGAEGTAQSAFLAASVSYKGATYDSRMGALRVTVDGIIAQKGLSTSTMCATSTVAAQ